VHEGEGWDVDSGLGSTTNDKRRKQKRKKGNQKPNKT
jgi:hypothetical protein